MLARLEPSLREKNVWMYPRLFWETGVLGQVLYLEAHAVGISATGIGCFFDDPGMLLCPHNYFENPGLVAVICGECCIHCFKLLIPNHHLGNCTFTSNGHR